MKRALLVLALAACRTGLPGASLTGQVVITGESAADVLVTASGAQTVSTRTDGDGRYVFDDLVMGSYTVSATVRATVEGRREASVIANGPAELPELRFTPAGGLEGRATRGGAASGNAGILVTVEGTGSVGITDDAGHYHIDLVPVGEYDLSAQLAGFRGGRASDQPVRWGETSQVPDINLQIGAGHAALRGVALLHGATNHGGTSVVVTGTGLTTTTASDGSWAIDGVPEGTFSTRFENGVFQETIPEVAALPGSDGFVIDESLYSLPRSPLTLFAARRFQQSRGYGNGFALSPNGTRLLYGESTDSTLRSVAIDGSGSITLADRWYGSIDSYGPDAAFSSDGTTVAFIGSDLRVVPALGGSATRLAYSVGSILFAPAGGLLGFLGVDPDLGNYALFAGTYPSGTPKLLASDSKMWPPRWSGDGSHLIYRTDVDDYWRLGTVRLVASSGGAPQTLATGAWEPMIRPDGRYALLQTDVSTWDASSNLWSVDLSTGTMAQLGSNVSHYDNILFAGTTHVVYRQDTHLYSIPIAGGSPVLLGEGSNLRVSADGSRVGFVNQCASSTNLCSLWAVPTTGGTPQMVASVVSDYSFSNDGNQLWFIGERDSRGLAQLSTWRVGGSPVVVDSGVPGWPTQFTSDGAHLWYPKDVTSDSHGSLMLAPTAGGPPVTLGRDVEVYGPRLSPDTKHIAFVQKPVGGTRSLLVAPLDGSPAVPMVDLLSDLAFTSKNALIARRSGSAAPYRFQDGFYVLQR